MTLKSTFNFNALLFVAACALFSCTAEEQSTDQTVDVTQTASESTKNISDDHFQKYGEDFKTLVGSPHGVMRGVELGISAEELKKVEKATLVDSSAGFLKYSVSINEDESALLNYLIIDGKVQGVNLLVNMKTENEIEAMSLEFNDFFTQKFGSANITEDGDEIWKPTDMHEIDIIEKESAEGFALEIDIR